MNKQAHLDVARAADFDGIAMLNGGHSAIVGFATNYPGKSGWIHGEVCRCYRNTRALTPALFGDLTRPEYHLNSSLLRELASQVGI